MWIHTTKMKKKKSKSKSQHSLCVAGKTKKKEEKKNQHRINHTTNFKLTGLYRVYSQKERIHSFRSIRMFCWGSKFLFLFSIFALNKIHSAHINLHAGLHEIRLFFFFFLLFTYFLLFLLPGSMGKISKLEEYENKPQVQKRIFFDTSSMVLKDIFLWYTSQVLINWIPPQNVLSNGEIKEKYEEKK